MHWMAVSRTRRRRGVRVRMRNYGWSLFLMLYRIGSDRSFLCSGAAEYTRVSAAEIRHAAARRMQFRLTVVLVLVFVGVLA